MTRKQKIACITLDIEPDLKDPQRRLRMFEDDALMDRYVSIVIKNQVKVTGFMVTSLFETYGPAIHRFADRIPMEFGVHSHSHDQKKACTENEVGKAFEAYSAFWGTAPLGYRAPNGLIDRNGINILMDYKFSYDASIFPSIRFDEYGYSNLHLPLVPFRCVRGDEEIIELPYACLRTIRLIFSFSYIKLMGLGLYKSLMIPFPLPDVVILGSHPYDFYVPLIAHDMKGWKKYAHLRNSERAFDLFEEIIGMLRDLNYEFLFMSELYNHVKGSANVPEVSVDEW